MKQLYFKVFITDLNIFVYDKNCKLTNTYLASKFTLPYGNVIKTVNKDIVEYNYTLLLNQLHLPVNSTVKDYRTSIK